MFAHLEVIPGNRPKEGAFVPLQSLCLVQLDSSSTTLQLWTSGLQIKVIDQSEWCDKKIIFFEVSEIFMLSFFFLP